MTYPSSTTVFKRERAAADLAEKTGILLVRRNSSEQVRLHLVSLDPTRTACRRYTHASWLGVDPRLNPDVPDRVCAECARAWKLTPEEVLAAFHEWRNAPR